MSVIKETYQLAASNSDILAAPSRLAAIPRNGILSIEASTTDCDATNNGKITLQLPGGDIPFEDLLIPANGYSTADSILHDDTALQFQLPVEQGGHVLVQYTETGTVALAFFVFTLQF